MSKGIKKRELNAMEKLVDIMYQVSDKEYILKYDEHFEWMDGMHNHVAIIREFYDEENEEMVLKKCDRYYSPQDLANFICSRIKDISRAGNDLKISELNLSFRAYRALAWNHINYLNDFKEQGITKSKLRRMRKVGEVTVNEIITELEKHGIELVEG